MKCQDAKRMLHERLDGDLSPADHSRLEEHLKDCVSCQEAESSLGCLAESLKELGTVPTPPGLAASIAGRLPALERVLSFSYRLRRVALVAALFVFLTAAAFVSSVLSEPQLLAENWPPLARQGDRFVISQGQVLLGDAVVYKGVLEIHGQVTGNIKLVDAKVELGATGCLLGSAEEVPPSTHAKLSVACKEIWERIRQRRAP